MSTVQYEMTLSAKFRITSSKGCLASRTVETRQYQGNFSFPKASDRLWGPNNEYRLYTPEVKPPEREARHSPPSIDKGKNDWGYMPTCKRRLIL